MSSVAWAKWAHRLALALMVVASTSSAARSTFQTSGRLVKERELLNRVRLGHDSRHVLHTPPRRFNVTIRPETRLRFAYANTVNAWGSNQREITLQITLHTLTGEHLVLFNARHVIEKEPKWYDRVLPLAVVAGRSGALELNAKTVPGGQPASQLVHWTNPILEPDPALDRPNIILISVDTLRADHLGYAGYHRPTSPNIDRLAREGVVFSHAIASSNWTLPSHASMLTGLHPARHRAIKFSFAALRTDVDTLAELLWDVGYDTGGFTGGGFVNFGFDQGFDRYWTPAPFSGKAESIAATLALAKQWMVERAARTFFLFLHAYAVHMPYEPPPPYNLMFDPDYQGPFRDGFSMKDNAHLGETPDAATLQRLVSLYDGELCHFDAQLGALLQYVRNSGLGDRTCVVVTSDHGEEFHEHGEMFHRRARLFDELLRVPLVVWCPARYAGGRVVDTPVSLVDVTPTILDIAGAPLPKDGDGRSLEPALLGGPLEGQLTFSEVDGSLEARPGGVRAVRSATHKLIESSLDGHSTMYDLVADPGETTDIAAREPAVAHELAAKAARLPTAPLESAPVSDEPREDAPSNAAVMERLRALGYVE
jgi:arylsulfatase A-like enzyme